MRRDALKGRESFHLTIPADENNLSEVRDFISDICQRAGFSKREINNTKLAMDEACTNIIKHAYRDISGEIRIDVEAAPGKVEINIFDRGTPFDWSKVKDPDLQQYVEIGKKGGLGIFLMNRLMDDLDYQATGEGNRLYMLKTAHGGAAAREPLFISVRPKWTSTLRFKFAMRATLGLLGLVIFLFAIQYVNQTREIEDLEREAWMGMIRLAGTLETKAENALMIDDPYDPQYRELTDFVLERVMKIPAVRYTRIVNNGGMIVASSTIEELMQPAEIPDDARRLSAEGIWRETRGPDGDLVRELQIPVLISRDDAAETVSLGRVVLGVSEQVIKAQIYDPRLKTGLILAGIFLVGVSLIYLLISVFVKPIQALTDGVRAIGAGSLEDEIRIDGPEEIGEIARAFNEITGRFREAQKSVVEQERMQKEMQVAQEIQHSLLPGRVPKVSGYDIASLYRAAKEVGGDYYDFVNVDEDTLGVVVADVSGKGVPGSLVMTMIRTALRMEARGSHSAADVMSRMNDFVTEDMKKGMFVTIFYVILDSKNRIISYASAGHNPMILYRAETDETFFLNPRGFPVGISLPDETLFRRSIDVEKIKLKKDDMLVIYTDGVTEAMNTDRQQYGEDRLLSLIKRLGRKAPNEFIEALNDDIARFTGGYPQNDDITVVAIKEKLMADDVLLGIRKKLLDLVDIEGLTVAEACARMKVSPSTYYRYRRRLSEMGERGLKNKALRTEHEIKRVSLEQRKDLLGIIQDDPKLGAKRIASRFNEGRPEDDALTTSLVYDELKRMRLNTYEKRLEYLRRNRFITEEEFQARLAGEPATAEREPVRPPLEAPEIPVEELPVEEEPVIAETPREARLIPAPVEGPGPGEDPVERLLREVLGSSTTEARLVEVSARNDEQGIIVLRVQGHLDSNAAGELEEFLESLSEYGFSKFVMDLSDVAYISSGGWGIFTGRVKTLRESDGDIVLAGMSPEVFDIYELLGFQDIIMHLRHADEAIDFIQLPLDVRKRRLEEISGTVAAEQSLEHRMSVSEPEEVDEEGEPVGWSPLRIAAGTVGERGEITVLELDGVIDTVSCMRLREVIESLIAKKVRKFVIDMSLVEYVSSAGWGVFAARIDDVRRDGGDIKVFGMDPEVDSIFHMLGFDVIMRSFSILSEAIDDFRQDVEPAVVAAQTVSRADTRPARPAAVDAGSMTEREPSRAPAPSAGGAAPDPRVPFGIDAQRSDRDESIVLHLAGAIDASTTDEFEARLESALERNPSYVVIDLADVLYISSSGWGVIVKCMQRQVSRGGRVALSGMTQPIYKIFRDLGFEPLIPHYLTSAKALEEFSAPDVREERKPVAVGTALAGKDREAPAKTAEASGAGATLAEAPVDETSATESSAGTGEERVTAAPSIPQRGVTPLGADRPETAPSLDVKLDLTEHEEAPEVSEEKIRRLGWKDYGERLRERDRKRSGRKQRG